MSDDLFAILDAFDPEDIALTFSKAESVADDLELLAELRILSTNESQSWSVQCRDVLDNSIRISADEVELRVAQDHPVLWPYCTPMTSLYFNGRCEAPEQLVGALYIEHEELTDGWFSFGRWLNPSVKLPRLLSIGSGLLAEGPEPVIRGYEQVIRRFGIETSKLSRPPMHWNGTTWVETIRPVVAMVSRASWAVAKSFQSKRL